MKSQAQLMTGWGKYPQESCHVYRPESRNDMEKIIKSGDQMSYIAFGLGRSYGDTSLNKDHGVILQSKHSRFLSFDEESAVLDCEGGVSLEQIIEVFLPKGYFLPVTPGTKFVTLGGAIANDVHGKNHHKDGCISEHIEEINLLLADGSTITCSRNENDEIFWATVGGVGLTGIILSAKIKLIRVETSYIEVDYLKAKNLDEALQMFEDGDDHYQYSVAWIDCLATGKSLGKSVLMRGNHAPLSKIDKRPPLVANGKGKLGIPFNFPSIVLNPLSIKTFNTLYYGKFKNSSTIVDYDSFFYPLDAINNWNKMYGKKGFVQYQVVFPPETSREGLKVVLERLSKSKRSSFLAVLKSFGEGNKGLFSFPFKGYTLALDIPIKDEKLFPFLRELDELVISKGGRLYLAKDSELNSQHFAQMYPTLDKFKKIKQEIDPSGVFSSSIARRVGIMEE